MDMWLIQQCDYNGIKLTAKPWVRCRLKAKGTSRPTIQLRIHISSQTVEELGKQWFAIVIDCLPSLLLTAVWVVFGGPFNVKAKSFIKIRLHIPSTFDRITVEMSVSIHSNLMNRQKPLQGLWRLLTVYLSGSLTLLRTARIMWFC